MSFALRRPSLSIDSLGCGFGTGVITGLSGEPIRENAEKQPALDFLAGAIHRQSARRRVAATA